MCVDPVDGGIFGIFELILAVVVIKTGVNEIVVFTSQLPCEALSPRLVQIQCIRRPASSSPRCASVFVLVVVGAFGVSITDLPRSADGNRLQLLLDRTKAVGGRACIVRRVIKVGNGYVNDAHERLVFAV